MIDLDSKAILCFDLSDAWSHDSKHFEGLLQATHTRLSEVYADAAYTSAKNASAVQAAGAVPFLRPKSTSKGLLAKHRPRRSLPMAYQLMISRYDEDPGTWLRKYGNRNTIESVFGAIKRRFGTAVAAYRRDMQRIETCLMVICWNLTRTKC